MIRQLVYLTTLLTIGGWAQAVAGALLAVDMNDRTVVDTPNSVAGFDSFLLTGADPVTTPVTQTIGAYSVTLAAFDDHMDENTTTIGVQDTVGFIDDRDRAAPVDGGGLSNAQIYDDFIFAQTANGPTVGMDLTISGGSLTPNTPYLVALYVYDNGSNAAPQPRSAAWLDANNGNSLVVNTSFNGTPTVPVSKPTALRRSAFSSTDSKSMKSQSPRHFAWRGWLASSCFNLLAGGDKTRCAIGET
jgi:hypothetical protein